MALYNFFVLLFIIVLPSLGQAHLKIGDELTINGQRIVIERLLGEGGFKKTFLATILNGQGQGQQIAVGINKADSPEIDPEMLKLNDRLNTSSSPFIRQEIPMVKAKVKNSPDEIYVTLMQYGQAGPLDKKRRGLDFESYRLLMEDIYTGIYELDSLGLLHTDIKPQNIIIMGGKLDNESIKSGHSYAALADFDGLYRANHKTDTIITTTFFSTPEYFKDNDLLSNASALWQSSVSMFFQLTREEPFTKKELIALSYYKSHDLHKAKEAQRVYQERLKSIKSSLERLIRKAKTPHERVMLEELNQLILNGFKLEPYDRQRWPQHIKRRRRDLLKRPPKKIPLELSASDLVRNYGSFSPSQVQSFINSRDPYFCLKKAAQTQIKKVNQLLNKLIKKAGNI